MTPNHLPLRSFQQCSVTLHIFPLHRNQHLLEERISPRVLFYQPCWHPLIQHCISEHFHQS